jgi:hypothetical protein
MSLSFLMGRGTLYIPTEYQIKLNEPKSSYWSCHRQISSKGESATAYLTDQQPRISSLCTHEKQLYNLVGQPAHRIHYWQSTHRILVVTSDRHMPRWRWLNHSFTDASPPVRALQNCYSLCLKATVSKLLVVLTFLYILSTYVFIHKYISKYISKGLYLENSKGK